jgi:hypothetical protein
MKPCLPFVVALALSVFAGCRSDPAIPLLERELYRKEREINRLQWQIEDLQDLLNSNDQRCVTRDGARDEPRPPDATIHGGYEPNGVPAPPTREMPGKPSDKMPDWMTRPRDSSPRSSAPRDDSNMRNSTPGPVPDSSNDNGPSLEGGASRVSSHRTADSPANLAASAVAFNPTGRSERVAGIELDRMLTGGINSGDRSGDQGLLVVVEPRDQAGRPIDAPADVNVAVLDPTLQGDAARVARWDFTAAETASLFRRAGTNGGMHLAMAWPKEPPKHNKLHLFVRYTTADGRKLEANQPIEIALAGDAPARWMASESPRPDEPPPSRNPPPKSWRPDDGAPTYMATRTSETRPERPVWSPERR